MDPHCTASMTICTTRSLAFSVSAERKKKKGGGVGPEEPCNGLLMAERPWMMGPYCTASMTICAIRSLACSVSAKRKRGRGTRRTNPTEARNDGFRGRLSGSLDEPKWQQEASY